MSPGSSPWCGSVTAQAFTGIRFPGWPAPVSGFHCRVGPAISPESVDKAVHERPRGPAMPLRRHEKTRAQNIGSALRLAISALRGGMGVYGGRSPEFDERSVTTIPGSDPEFLPPRPRLEALDLHQAHLVAGEALDLAHEVTVLVPQESHGDAGAPRAAGAADAVHVVLRLAWRVVVHHQVDPRHVDAA